MRNLTIKRQKSVVASLATMKVYISDTLNGELLIGGVNCRLLGGVKNGQEATFSIPDEAARIYVIADKVSKEFCNEYYDIPQGSENVHLTGKNKFNPAAGNAFQFDGVTDGQVLANRKKSARKGMIVLAVGCIVGCLVGWAIGYGIVHAKNAAPKDFTVEDMTITLTKDFTEDELEGQTAYLVSDDVAVAVLKEEFAMLPGFEDLTVEEYGQFVAENSDGASAVKTSDGLTWCERTFVGEYDMECYHYLVFYKTDDAYWMIQFMVLEKDANQYKDRLVEWAKSVKFAD